VDICSRRVFASIAFFAVFLFASLSHSENLTYENVLKDALNASARLRMKKEDVHISFAAHRQAAAGLFPEISVNSRLERYENLDKRNIGIDTISGEVVGGSPSAWRTDVYLSGRYDLSSWYKKRFDVGYYEKLRDASVHDCEAETKKFLQELTSLFGQLSEKTIRRKYAADVFDKLVRLLHLRRGALTEGEASQEDVIRAEADAANAEKELAAVAKEMKEDIARLYGYTGKRYPEDVEMETLKSDGKVPLGELSTLIGATPEYMARQKELEAAKLKAKAIENNDLPDISFYTRYDYYGSDSNSLDGSMRELRETSYNAGIFITFPLFNGGVKKWERKKILHEVRRQMENVRALMEEKGRDIQSLQTGYGGILRSLDSYRKLTGHYSRMLAIARKAGALGQRSTADLLSMEKDALFAERDLAVTENTLAIYEKKLLLETDYHGFMKGFDGNGTCRY
jgi:outer membrane protein TolC